MKEKFESAEFLISSPSGSGYHSGEKGGHQKAEKGERIKLERGLNGELLGRELEGTGEPAPQLAVIQGKDNGYRK